MEICEWYETCNERDIFKMMRINCNKTDIDEVHKVCELLFHLIKDDLGLKEIIHIKHTDMQEKLYGNYLGVPQIKHKEFLESIKDKYVIYEIDGQFVKNIRTSISSEELLTSFIDPIKCMIFITNDKVGFDCSSNVCGHINRRIPITINLD